MGAAALVEAGPDAVRAYGSYTDARKMIDTATSPTGGPLTILNYSYSTPDGLIDVTGARALLWIKADIEKITAAESWQYFIRGDAPNFGRQFAPASISAIDAALWMLHNGGEPSLATPAEHRARMEALSERWGDLHRRPGVRAAMARP